MTSPEVKILRDELAGSIAGHRKKDTILDRFVSNITELRMEREQARRRRTYCENPQSPVKQIHTLIEEPQFWRQIACTVRGHPQQKGVTRGLVAQLECGQDGVTRGARRVSGVRRPAHASHRHHEQNHTRH